GDKEREIVVRVYSGGDGDDDGASAVGWPELTGGGGGDDDEVEMVR
ncbi:hypothetical protein Tco_1298500, partial [Tanacetum coccineum]